MYLKSGLILFGSFVLSLLVFWIQGKIVEKVKNKKRAIKEILIYLILSFSSGAILGFFISDLLFNIFKTEIPKRFEFTIIMVISLGFIMLFSFILLLFRGISWSKRIDSEKDKARELINDLI